MLKTTASATLLFATSLLLASSPAAQAQSGTPKTAPAPAGSLERTLSEFGSWVGKQVDRAEEVTRREVPKVTAEFDRRSRRLDQAIDSLSAESQREYAAQKTRYQQWATRQDSLDAAARQPTTPAQAQARLLNENVNISRARATELPNLYQRLVETMRTEKKAWSQADWTTADEVLSRLNARYEQVRTQLPLEERLRIRTLQGEFRTLEKARNVKDSMRD
ncbi:hypothetical protein J7E24_02155 [Hymenobacter sp. ISL-91]|uniref:DUF6565 domain-containing protein n=1 Tax=Hymenobacter sp. ISL-91 TaxID=2819151 RepID=UPI001BE5B668|nr:DUF6565 domain-containing protein [Hymenobacter sp. ISL-91]MBT2556574.1 hypothetical protein [Hymenobacter sp. ISL-91]